MITKDQMIYIPAGKFEMGYAGEDATREEKPVQEVHLDGFWISKYPVTNAEYHEFLAARRKRAVPYEKYNWAQPYNWDKKTRSYPPNKEEHPVVLVSWFDAVAYCKWLSKELDEDAWLPTEAQWEKAARGTDGRRYPWGNEWDAARCNSRESKSGGTLSVRQFSPAGDSPYGVANMSGNVWEWTNSLFRLYPYDATDGREHRRLREYRIVRGGSWLNTRQILRCSYRVGTNPLPLLHNIGFRVVINEVPPRNRRWG